MADVSAEPLFGPETYNRTQGQPNEYTKTFANCEPEAKYELLVLNGDESGTGRLSSATILLNGQEVLRPNDFNQQVERITRSVQVLSENTLEIRLASMPDGQLTISIECVENCFEIEIELPASGAVVNLDRVLVTGTITTGTGEAGVFSGFSPGFVVGPPFSFAVPEVPVAEGQNSITVIGTNTCGMKASAIVEIQVEAVKNPVVILMASPPGGVAPLSVQLRTLAIPPDPIVGYAWNFTNQTNSELSVTYDTPGLYFPEVTVTDAGDNTHFAVTVVYVLDPDHLDGMLKAKWHEMREAMEEGDIEETLNYFTHGSRDRYRQIFEAIELQLSEEASGLEDLELVTFRGTTAKYRIHRTVTVDNIPRVLTYYVYFIQDGDGIWRIKQF